MKKYDYVIVGAGFFGATFANLMHQAGKSVLVVEQRDIPGGNCSTKEIEGIHVHMHGPHIFRTNKSYIWDYINQFGKFKPYFHRVKAKYKNTLYSFPVNMMTFHQLWHIQSPDAARKKIQSEIIPCDNPSNIEEFCLANVGTTIYERFIKGYTEKQWGQKATSLPAWIIKRLPIRYTFEDHYFHNDSIYEGIPINGYTSLFHTMLSNVAVEYNVNFLEDKTYFLNKANQVIYTGSIDAFFDYELGRLPYRSLKFEHKYSMGDRQGCPVINYTEADIPYTRTIEHKHFLNQNTAGTILTKEFPCRHEGDSVPYYPINNDSNNALHQQYVKMLSEDSRVIAGGRLGMYRYFDMDHAIAAAHTLAKGLLK